VYLLAVRDGVVGALPLVLISSAFLIVAQPPVQSLQPLVQPHLALLLLPVKMLTKAIALYVAFGVGHSLARQYKLDPLSGGLISVACLLTSTAPMALAPRADGTAPVGFGIWSEGVGPAGIFPALLLAVLAVEIQRFMVARRLVIRLPAGVPEPIIQSFMAFIPGLVAVSLTWLIIHAIGFDLHEAISNVVRPMVRAGNSYLAMVSVALVDSVFWLLGVHPTSVLSVAKPVWLQRINENISAAGNHTPLPHIAPRETYLSFVWFGGSGGTLILPFLLWRAKSSLLRAIARAAIVPAFFNINEPILFGIPVVLNRGLAVPFISGPLVSVTLAYLALSNGWVSPPHNDCPWTMPAPIYAFVTTHDWRAVILLGLNMFLSALIYWPFLRRYDRELADKEAASPA
jgi:PTS system cellobiose-specific IIC component